MLEKRLSRLFFNSPPFQGGVRGGCFIVVKLRSKIIVILFRIGGFSPEYRARLKPSIPKKLPKIS